MAKQWYNRAGTEVTPYTLTAGGLVRLADPPIVSSTAPVVVGVVSGGGQAGPSGLLNLTPPPGAVSYVAVVICAAESHPSYTIPPGWSIYLGGDNSYDPNWSRYFILTAKAVDNPNFYFGDTVASYKEHAVAIAGYDSEVLLSAAQETEYNNTSGDWTGTSPSITLSQSALVLRVAIQNNNNTSPTVIYPSSATAGRANGIGRGADNIDCVVAAIAHESRSAGSTGTASWTILGDAYRPTSLSIQVAKA